MNMSDDSENHTDSSEDMSDVSEEMSDGSENMSEAAPRQHLTPGDENVSQQRRPRTE